MTKEPPPCAGTGGHEWGPLPPLDEDGVTRTEALCCGVKAELRGGEWRLVE